MSRKTTIDELQVNRTLYQVAQKYPEGQQHRWSKIAEEMNLIFGFNKRPLTWKGIWARLRVQYGLTTSTYYKSKAQRPLSELIGEDAQKLQEGPRSEESPRIITHIKEAVLRPEEALGGLKETLDLLSQKSTLSYLSTKLNLPPKVVLASIESLKESGHQIVEVDGVYWNIKTPIIKRNEIKQAWNGERVIRFGVVSDTHQGNHYQQMAHLETFYDRCVEREIDTVYHGGDLSDGFYPNRPEHIFELHAVGLEAQAKYIINNYPKRNGITTKFIEGNHDATHMKNGGGSIGRRIEVERKDMEYLGYGKVKVWLTPKCDMDVVHPNGGKSYALSYKLQKAIDAIQGGNKPRILLMGHYHAFCNIWYRNVHAYMLPGFQAQNMWATLGSLQFQVGGIIFEVTVNDEGEITGIQATLYPFYVMREKDY